MNKTLLPLCIFFVLAASASAEIIGVEQFDYPNGAIAGESGGTFWDYKDISPAGHTGTASSWQNVASAPATSGAKLITSNSSARRTYDGASESDGAVNDPASAPSSVAHTVYYRVTVTTGATLPDFFGLSSYDFTNERIFFGKTFGSSTFSLTGGTHVGSNNVPVAANTTYTLVTKIDFVNDVIALYVNPDLNAMESTQNPAVNATYTGTNFSTAVRLASGNTGSAVTWGDLVVATTWEDLGTVVTTTADEDNGSLSPTDGGGTGVSLREAVKYSPNGTLITFAPSLNGKTITLTAGDIPALPSGILSVDASSLTSGLTIDLNGTGHFIINTNDTLKLRSLTLTGGNVGGAVNGALSNLGSLTLIECTVMNNSNNSAAIFSQGSSLTLMRCTLTGNTSPNGSGGGGALLLAGGTNTLTRCTVAGNLNSGTLGGGGIYIQAPASLILNNTIVAGNVDTTGLSADIFNANNATITTNGTANLIGQNTTVESTFPAGPLIGTAAAPLNPKLAPLGYFGGPTQTMHPLIGSPAIDAGGTTNPGTLDQRGFPGFVDGDNNGTAQLDIGAVEAGPLFTVNTPGDASGDTLRAYLTTIASLSGLSGPRIAFNSSVFPAANVTLSQGELAILSSINGLFIDASILSGPVTISGNNASRVFNISSGATVAMHSLNIINGKSADGTTGSSGSDGGGSLNGGSLSLFSSTISSNRTGNGSDGSFGVGSGGRGGGIFSNGALSLTACTLSGNSSGNGGNSIGTSASSGGDGGYGGGIFSGGPLSLTACTLSGNSTGNGGNATANGVSAGRGGEGGGIRKGDNIPYHLTACTIAGNRTGSGGTAPSGNNFPGDGGGLSSGSATLQYCLVAQNSGFSSPQDVNVFAITYLGANLLGTHAAGSSSGPSPIIADPLLAPLDNYGGPTKTIALLMGSPARDAAVGSFRRTDQRGFAITDGKPDLGAYEAGDISNYFAWIYENLPASTASDGAAHATTFDYDGDGVSNYNEWLTLTNPADPTSYLHFTEVTKNGGAVQFSFPTVAGRHYTIQQSADLLTWTTSAFGTIQGNGNPFVFGFLTSAGPKQFFRVLGGP
jgi:hypothetical protein